MIRKVMLITLACSVLIAYGVMQTRLSAHSGGFFSRSFTPDNVDVAVQPPAGSRFVRSYESSVNGTATQFAHYVSAVPAEALVGRFLDQHPGAEKAPLPNIVRGGGCTAAAYTDRSQVVSVIAFDTPNGCNFFLGRTPLAPARKAHPNQDVPGVDAPGVPRPLNSIRMMSAKDIGGIPSVLAFYEGWGSVDDNIDHFRDRMARGGWKAKDVHETFINEEMEGDTLVYTKGTSYCLIHLEHDARSGRIHTAIMYREKDWLPPQ